MLTARVFPLIPGLVLEEVLFILESRLKTNNRQLRNRLEKVDEHSLKTLRFFLTSTKLDDREREKALAIISNRRDLCLFLSPLITISAANLERSLFPFSKDEVKQIIELI
jgi:hypothetical protein